MRGSASAIAGVLFLAAATPAVAASAAAVDPQIVGTWQMSVPGPAGIAVWVWDIRADGTYTFHTEGGIPAPGHSGIVTFNAGRWSLTATRGMQWRDGGTYQLGNPDLLIEMGVLGTAAWNRVGASPQVAPSQQQASATPPRAPQTNVPSPRADTPPSRANAKPPSSPQNFVPQPGGASAKSNVTPPAQQQASTAAPNDPPQTNSTPQPNAQPQAPASPEAPRYLPNPLRLEAKAFGIQRMPVNVVEMGKVAAGMHKGEFLVGIGIGATPRSNAFHADFDLWSPRMNEIATATTSTGIAEMQVTTPSSSPPGRIPLEFTEFTAALEVAKTAGMAEGALLGAGLRVVYIGLPKRVLYWTITEKPKTKDGNNVVYYIDALSGKLLPGTPDANRQAITPEWEEAARLYSAYAAKQLPQPSTMPETNTRRPNSCIVPAACRAMETNDPRAADRIDGGMPAEQDIQKYDK
jgi:hypothetical protein